MPAPRRSNRTLFIVLGGCGGLVVLVIIAIVILAAIGGSSPSKIPLVNSSSTDGTFHSGDCITIGGDPATGGQVRKASSCAGTIDGEVIQVVHSSSDQCPSGTQRLVISDGTGDLCVDRSVARS